MKGFSENMKIIHEQVQNFNKVVTINISSRHAKNENSDRDKKCLCYSRYSALNS